MYIWMFQLSRVEAPKMHQKCCFFFGSPNVSYSETINYVAAQAIPLFKRY